jgi:hypothetical protein
MRDNTRREGSATPRRGNVFVLLPALLLAAGACAPGPEDTPHADLTASDVGLAGEWVRTGHAEAWFVTFGEEGRVVLENSVGQASAGSYALRDSTHVEIHLPNPTVGLSDALELTIVDRGDEWVRLTGPNDESWEFFRFDALPEELLGRWLDLPRNDPRFFIEFTSPNNVVWRRRHGMRRTEDRLGKGWMRGDSLFLHQWGFPPVLYTYRISGDSLNLERPGLGPRGSYLRPR